MIDPKYLRKDGGIKHTAPVDVKLLYFIQAAKQVHGLKYDYSQQKYTRAIDKVEILCPTHGSFFQAPNNHVSKKHGCPQCAHPSSRKTTEQFIKEAEALGYGYDYSDTVYADKDTKVSITCLAHGVFSMRPDAHTSQYQGCPKCQGKNFSILYLLRCNTSGLVKIGITNNLSKRLSTIGGGLQVLQQFKIKEPQKREKELHSRFNQLRVVNHNVKSGSTEFFSLSNQQVSELKEELFKEVML